MVKTNVFFILIFLIGISIGLLYLYFTDVEDEKGFSLWEALKAIKTEIITWALICAMLTILFNQL